MSMEEAEEIELAIANHFKTNCENEIEVTQNLLRGNLQKLANAAALHNHQTLTLIKYQSMELAIYRTIGHHIRRGTMSQTVVDSFNKELDALNAEVQREFPQQQQTPTPEKSEIEAVNEET